MPEFITVTEAAKLLKVHVATIRNWLKSGKIKGKKLVGTQWRVSLDDIKKILS